MDLQVGRQLGQLRPADTTAASVFSPVAGQRAEITRIYVCNQTAGALQYRVFHDEDGTTYDETTALYFDISIPANNTVGLFNLGLWMADSSGNLGVRTSAGNGITFTVYGIEHDMVA